MAFYAEHYTSHKMRCRQSASDGGAAMFIVYARAPGARAPR